MPPFDPSTAWKTTLATWHSERLCELLWVPLPPHRHPGERVLLMLDDAGWGPTSENQIIVSEERFIHVEALFMRYACNLMLSILFIQVAQESDEDC